MANVYAVQAVRPAMAATQRFFSGPSIAGKWLKIALIVWLSGFMLGGFSLPGFSGSPSQWPSASPTPAAVNPLAASSASSAGNLSDNFNKVAPFAFFAILVIAVLSAALLLVHSLYLFVLFRSLERDDPRVLSYLAPFYGRGAGLFLGRLALGAASLLSLAGLGLSFYRLFPFLFSATGLPPAPLDGASAVVLFLGSLAALAGLALLGMVQEHVVAYLMFRRGLGLRAGWRESLRLIRARPLQMLAFFAVRLVLGAALAAGAFLLVLLFLLPGLVLALFLFALFLVSLAVPLLLVLVLAMGFLAALVLYCLYLLAEAPLDVFFAEYHLAFYNLLLGKAPKHAASKRK